MKLHMVDLEGQYLKIKSEVDKQVLETIASTRFIGGQQVENFTRNLADYLKVNQVIPCANGTDALQIAMMALKLKPGDEVIVPAFTYVATAEVIALLGLKPIMVDVDLHTFNVTAEIIKPHINSNTKAIVPVHLFGQNADMAPILDLAKEHDLWVIEDAAQSIGSEYRYPDGQVHKSGTMGHIGCTSFFPSKNLGCFGDGGAIYTQDEEIGNQLRMVANHGQSKRYYHDQIGVNSRLDAIQAAILNVKLPHLDTYCEARTRAADEYDLRFKDNQALITPFRANNSTHVFHQYTLRVINGSRDQLRKYLDDLAIPHNVYYPVPLYEQKAFAPFSNVDFLPVTDQLCKEVISLPIHTEMNVEMLDYIADKVNRFFKS